MPNTDIDGNTMICITKTEALSIYGYLAYEHAGFGCLDEVDQKLADKISRDLNLPALE